MAVSKVSCTPQGKVIVTKGSEVKLFSQDADMSLFSNYPRAAVDKVYLNVNDKDLHYLIKHSNSKDLGSFYE